MFPQCLGPEIFSGACTFRYNLVVALRPTISSVASATNHDQSADGSALLPSCGQLPVPFGMNILLASGEHVLRRDVADGTVQANVVVVLDVTLHQALRIL